MRSEYLGVAERDALQEEVERHGRRLAEVEALAKAEGWGAVHLSCAADERANADLGGYQARFRRDGFGAAPSSAGLLCEFDMTARSQEQAQ